MGLAVRLNGLALGNLALEAGLLVDGVVQLAECVAVLGAVDEILKALGEGRVGGLAFGQRADLDGVVIDEGGLMSLSSTKASKNSAKIAPFVGTSGSST